MANKFITPNKNAERKKISVRKSSEPARINVKSNQKFLANSKCMCWSLNINVLTFSYLSFNCSPVNLSETRSKSTDKMKMNEKSNATPVRNHKSQAQREFATR